MNAIEQQAKGSLRNLVAHALAHQDGLIEALTYQELARRIGRLNKHGEGHAHGMGGVLAQMGFFLENMGGQWGEPIPHIQILVVNKTGTLKGLPDEGIEGFWPGYSMMSKAEKSNRVRAEHQKVVAFGSRWNQVLEALALPKIHPSGGKGQHGKGGESDAHKALKNHVRGHPEIVGTDEGCSALLEYALPSLDQIDVVFRTSTEIVAVEVKSKISDHYPDDYERGIYQTVKYGALLEAMTHDDKYDIPAGIRSVLVLETQLPKKYAKVADVLGVEVIEHVAVGGD